MSLEDTSIITGLGALWLGGHILWVGGLPRQLRGGEKPSAPKGTPEAFQLFWMDQYGYIGLTLFLGGLVLSLLGATL